MPKERLYDCKAPEDTQLTVHWANPAWPDGWVSVGVWDTTEDPAPGKVIHFDNTDDLYRLEKAIRRARKALDKKLTKDAVAHLENMVVLVDASDHQIVNSAMRKNTER